MARGKSKATKPLTPKELETLRAEMHSQVPIARAQIRALRTQAKAVSADHKLGSTGQIGSVLTSIMLAGFALELGLKIFHMTYRHERPHGHDLQKLFAELPDQIRADISASFAASTFPKPPIGLHAFKVAGEAPSPPAGVTISPYDTAENIIRSAANAFTNARYFFEDIISADWVILENAAPYMCALSDVLDVVYDAYESAGGWGSPDLK